MRHTHSTHAGKHMHSYTHGCGISNQGGFHAPFVHAYHNIIHTHAHTVYVDDLITWISSQRHNSIVLSHSEEWPHTCTNDNTGNQLFWRNIILQHIHSQLTHARSCACKTCTSTYVTHILGVVCGFVGLVLIGLVVLFIVNHQYHLIFIHKDEGAGEEWGS